MPFSHRINPDNGFGVIRLTGSVSGSDLLDALAWFYAHDDWAPGSRVLWDGRAIESFVLTPEELHAAAEIVEEAVSRLGMERTAVVAGNLDSYMGGSLLAARLGKRTGRAARAFSELAPALEWLATPSSPLHTEDVLLNDIEQIDIGGSAVIEQGALVEGARETGPVGAD